MTPTLRQRLESACAPEIDTLDMLDVTCKAFPMSFHKRERKDAEFVYKRAFAASSMRLQPLLAALIDIAEAADLSVETTRNLAERERRIHEALARVSELCGEGK